VRDVIPSQARAKDGPINKRNFQRNTQVLSQLHPCGSIAGWWNTWRAPTPRMAGRGSGGPAWHSMPQCPQNLVGVSPWWS